MVEETNLSTEAGVRGRVKIKREKRQSMGDQRIMVFSLLCCPLDNSMRVTYHQYCGLLTESLITIEQARQVLPYKLSEVLL